MAEIPTYNPPLIKQGDLVPEIVLAFDEEDDTGVYIGPLDFPAGTTALAQLRVAGTRELIYTYEASVIDNTIILAAIPKSASSEFKAGIRATFELQTVSADGEPTTILAGIVPIEVDRAYA